ncbi:hypothetical protein Salat_1661400 [Sesamum alatum]|uniref:DUF4283 domain-containing protein n=1 Tax=Sesamum alatum TaxID=300844 RepID=A0AAE1Y7T0_9LAMI|nr:hypothetical protein Salat_1661400 [Sesamum alatum]
MADDMGKMAEVLSETDLELGSVMVSLTLWHENIDAPGFYLVGRLLGRHNFNFEAMKNTLMNAFNPIKGLEIRLIDNGRILFNFAHTLDRQRVIDSGPWAFDKNLLILRVVEADDDPAKIDLDWADLFIHVHGLSLGRMTRNMAEFIGNQIGRFRDVDIDRGGQLWGSSLRIRVGLDVTKPIRRYEPGFDASQDPLPYEPWLRATTPAQLRSRGVNYPPPRPSIITIGVRPPSYNPHRGPAIFNYSPTVTQPIQPPTTSHLAPPSSPYVSTIPSPPSPLLTANIVNTLLAQSSNHHTLTIQTYSTTFPAITTTRRSPTTVSTATAPQPLPHLVHHPLPICQALTNVPLTFTATSNPSLSHSQLSSTSGKGRKKSGNRKIISVPRKRKLIDETLDAIESPSKCVKQTNLGLEMLTVRSLFRIRGDWFLDLQHKDVSSKKWSLVVHSFWPISRLVLGQFGRTSLHLNMKYNAFVGVR